MAAHRKLVWPPCAECGDPDGPAKGYGNTTPIRVSGAPYGIDGQLCQRCFQRLRSRRNRHAGSHALRLATLVLAFRDAHSAGEMGQASDHIKAAIRLAEVVVAPATATRGDEGEA